MQDRYGREIDYMRVSITDRCNLRCRYCMPFDLVQVPREDILSYEEIAAVCTGAARAGICKIKITGGEPLTRKGCPGLIGRIRQIPGISQVTLTTNGVLLESFLEELIQNGLESVNISLDTLKRDRFREITGRDELPRVLKSIYASVDAGLRVKINTVLQKGFNEDEWRDLAELSRDLPVDVRFIELMPIGYGKDFQAVSNEELKEKILTGFPGGERDSRIHGNGPAVYVKIPGFQGSIGFIGAIHEKFCDHCNRIRLTAQGSLKPCLCYGDSLDLREILRGSGDFEEKIEGITRAIREAVREKPKEHHFENRLEVTEDKTMNRIGG